MSFFKILVGVLCCSAAQAATLNVSWTHPVTNVDGSGIPASGPGSIVSTRVEFGSCNGVAFGVRAGESVVPVPANTLVIQDIAPGTYCVRAFSLNTYGQESVASNVASKVVPVPVPNPPVVAVPVVAGLNMTPVFKLSSTGKRSAEAAGFVPVGTACTGNVLFYYRNHGYRRVDSSLVSWWGEIVPSVDVAASCA